MHTPETAALYLAERGYLAEGGGKKRGKHPPTADTIRRMIYAGRLPARRFSGRAWAIDQAALDELLAACVSFETSIRGHIEP